MTINRGLIHRLTANSIVKVTLIFNTKACSTTSKVVQLIAVPPRNKASLYRVWGPTTNKLIGRRSAQITMN